VVFIDPGWLLPLIGAVLTSHDYSNDTTVCDLKIGEAFVGRATAIARSVHQPLYNDADAQSAANVRQYGDKAMHPAVVIDRRPT